MCGKYYFYSPLVSTIVRGYHCVPTTTTIQETVRWETSVTKPLPSGGGVWFGVSPTTSLSGTLPSLLYRYKCCTNWDTRAAQQGLKFATQYSTRQRLAVNQTKLPMMDLTQSMDSCIPCFCASTFLYPITSVEVWLSWVIGGSKSGLNTAFLYIRTRPALVSRMKTVSFGIFHLRFWSAVDQHLACITNPNKEIEMNQ